MYSLLVEHVTPTISSAHVVEYSISNNGKVLVGAIVGSATEPCYSKVP